MDVKEMRIDLSDPGHGSLAGFCEHGNELWISLKCWEFLSS
jgi:hypothetical protein